jgi:hypothetical protein
MSRFESLRAHEEAWHTFSWSEHLALDIPYPHTAPCVSGGTVVVPVYERRGVRSFLVQTIPSPLRGVPNRRWEIELDFFVQPFILDATQDLLAVVPEHDANRLVGFFTISPYLFTYLLTRVNYPAACSCAHYLQVSHTPSLPMRGFFVWRSPDTFLWEIVSVR